MVASKWPNQKQYSTMHCKLGVMILTYLDIWVVSIISSDMSACFSSPSHWWLLSCPQICHLSLPVSTFCGIVAGDHHNMITTRHWLIIYQNISRGRQVWEGSVMEQTVSYWHSYCCCWLVLDLSHVSSIMSHINFCHVTCPFYQVTCNFVPY